MKLKRIFNLCLSTAICFILFTGCGNTKSSISADLSYTQSDIGTISVSSDVQIVGLGEASHGVAQYHQMKLDVFKALVENNGCHTFIIEGDFGGALKVDQYINGGNGTTTNGTTTNGTTTNTTSNNTTSTSSSDEVKTADNSHIARYGILVVFALLDAVMAFFALRLRRRDD